MLPLETNIKEAYANGSDSEQQFIQNLALFLCTFLKDRGTLVEKKQLNDALLKVSNVSFLFRQTASGLLRTAEPARKFLLTFLPNNTLLELE